MLAAPLPREVWRQRAQSVPAACSSAVGSSPGVRSRTASFTGLPAEMSRTPMVVRGSSVSPLRSRKSMSDCVRWWNSEPRNSEAFISAMTSGSLYSSASPLTKVSARSCEVKHHVTTMPSPFFSSSLSSGVPSGFVRMKTFALPTPRTPARRFFWFSRRRRFIICFPAEPMSFLPRCLTLPAELRAHVHLHPVEITLVAHSASRVYAPNLLGAAVFGAEDPPPPTSAKSRVVISGRGLSISSSSDPQRR